MLDRQQTVARIVLDHSECAAVFHRHRIDYCCHGAVSLDQACVARGLDADQIAAELERTIALRVGPSTADPRTFSTPALVAHIITQHHEPLRAILPFARALAAKVARVHGERHPNLHAVEASVNQLADTLEPHLTREETVLFPALMMPAANHDIIAHELAEMHADHLVVAGMLEDLRRATGAYTPPPGACSSYRTLFAELAALETDLLRHVHLENHVLLPRFVPVAA